MTIIEPAIHFRPSGTYLHVRLIEPADRSEGGVWLPETAQQNTQEAHVIACGPGRLVPGHGWRSIMYVKPGDRVFFLPHSLEPIVGDRWFGQVCLSRGWEGAVREEELLGVVDAAGHIQPLNDWVLCGLEEWEEQKGALHVPELDQHRPPCGRVLAVGPGRLRQKGSLYLTRASLCDILQVANDSFLIGRRVWWDRSEHVHEVGRETVESVLVRADALIGYEEEDGEEEGR